MRGKATFQKKTVTVIRIIKTTPIRALRKAKDIYIKGIKKFSTTYSRPTMIFEDSNPAPPRKLTRANSMGVTKAELTETRVTDDQLQQQPCGLMKKGLQRSCSVVMGRIDEDRVSSFREDFNTLLNRNFVVRNIESRLSKSESRRF